MNHNPKDYWFKRESEIENKVGCLTARSSIHQSICLSIRHLPSNWLWPRILAKRVVLEASLQVMVCMGWKVGKPPWYGWIPHYLSFPKMEKKNIHGE